MQPSATRDFAVGLFVLAGLAAIGYLTLQVGGLSYKGPGGFPLEASFDHVGDLDRRSPVKVSGVKVGQVSRIELGPDLRARVYLDLDPSLALPVDSSARIRSESLLGGQFVELEPGAEEDLLAPGDEIAFTESYVSIDGLLGKFVHDAGLEDEGT